jgi:hypothetical protein
MARTDRIGTRLKLRDLHILMPADMRDSPFVTFVSFCSIPVAAFVPPNLRFPSDAVSCYE